MKSLFITPQIACGNNRFYQAVPPLGLGYLAAALRKYGFDADIFDCNIQHRWKMALKSCIQRQNPRVVGIQVYSVDLNMVDKCIKFVKTEQKDAVIVLGGPHPSGRGVEIFNDLSGFDYAFAGEAEISFPLLVQYLSKNNGIALSEIPGLIWQDKTGITNINKCNYIDELDVLDFPAWDLMHIEKYRIPHGVFTNRYPSAPIITSRGCSYGCKFCASHKIFGKKFRQRSVENIIDEIKVLCQNYFIKEICIEDDNFTYKKIFVCDFCETLLSKNINISWSCPNGVRLDSLDGEMLELMNRSGCHSLGVGIESGSQQILNNMNKALSLKEIQDTIVLIRSKGIEVTGFFIIGYPGETVADVEKTISFSLNLDIAKASFANFCLLPGTQTFEELKGKLAHVFSLAKWDTKKICNVVAKGNIYMLSKIKLNGLILKAYIKFYLRLKIFLYLVKQFRNIGQTTFVLKKILKIIVS